MSVFVVIATAAFFIVGMTSLKFGERQRLRANLVTYQLRFSRQLDLDGVTAFLAGLTGLLLPWWRRWLTTPFVVSEVVANPIGIEHRLLIPEAWSSTLENLLQAHLPAVAYRRVDLDQSSAGWGAEYRLSSRVRMLRVDPAAVSARLLSSLQPLRGEEEILVQWALTPAAPVAPVSSSPAATQGPWWWPARAQPSGEEAAALHEKQAQPLLLAVARISVRTRSRGRARSLLRQVETSWHGTRAPGVQLLRRRLVDERRVARRAATRNVPLVNWAGTFNSDELAGLLGWPVGVEQVPGVVLGGCRPLAPSPLIASTGTVIGTANFPGSERPLAIDVEARLRHLHVVGPTGTGKSTLLLHLIEQDLDAGHGVVVIDPKGDLVTDVLARVPARRRDDVVVLDPADDAYPVGLNPLASAEGARVEVAVENLVGLFKSLYRASWGPRTDDILRAALMTLGGSGSATLCEVPLLLTDSVYRRRLVGKLDDPIGLESFWGWYEALSDSERLSVIGPVLNKVRAFAMRPRVRAIVGQAEPALVMADVLAERRVLLVSLGSGVLGQEAAALLGALVFAEVWHATTARAGLPPRDRHLVSAHLDEWQRFLHLPTPMASVLAEARGMGLGLVLAHQHLGQLPEAIREAVLANARSRLAFQLPAHDARILARELGGGLTPEDLQGLGAFEVVAQLFAAGRTQPPVTAQTHAPSQPTSDGDEVRQRSRERYGVARADVEAQIRGRQAGQRVQAPIRQRRRRGGPS